MSQYLILPALLNIVCYIFFNFNVWNIFICVRFYVDNKIMFFLFFSMGLKVSLNLKRKIDTMYIQMETEIQYKGVQIYTF